MFGRFGVWARANPLKVFSVVLVLAVVSGVAVYAYLGLLTPQAGPRVTIISPPLEFSLELDKAEYQYGENITIVLCLRNMSNQTITMDKRSRWPYWRGHPVGPVVFTEFYGVSPEDENKARGLIHFGFSITHQNGTVIFRQYEGPLAATYDIDIYAGGYIKQAWIWDLPLPKATYQIRGILSCAVPGTFWHSTLETPSITFIVNNGRERRYGEFHNPGAIVYAYLQSFKPQAGPRVTITSPPLEFSLELDKTEYPFSEERRSGENITITFCLKNISNQTITVHKNTMLPIDSSLNCLTTEADRANADYPLLSALFHFGFSITDENGTEIFKEFRGPLQAIYSFTIEPNGYVKQTLIWNSPTGVGSTLPRGVYQIRGIFHGAVVPGFKLSTLETPSITFTIK